MKLDSFLIVTLCTLFIACSGNRVRNAEQADYEDKCSVENDGHKVYTLDDNTSCNMEYMQFIDGDSLQLFSFLNAHRNAIYLYNEVNGELLDTLVFAKEGANGVGSIQGYYYHNNDSIFISEYGSGIIRLVNHSGIVYNKYQLYDADVVSEDTTRFLPIPYLTTYNPVFYHTGKIIMNGGIMVETNMETATNTFVSLIYDVTDSSLLYDNTYPEQYRKYDWAGGFTFRQPYSALDTKGNLLISFPADHNLWVYDLASGKRDSVYAGSRFIDEIIPYNSLKKKYPDDIPAEAEMDWYYGQPSYEGIFYDPYRKLYYRIARLPNVKHRPNTFNDKPVVVIVLDENLNYLGEEQLLEGVIYDPYNAYVTRDGFYIHIRTNDEDHLTFFRYNVKKQEV